MKEEFMAGKIQAYPDFDSNEPFILTMDWYQIKSNQIYIFVPSQKHRKYHILKHIYKHETGRH